MRQEHQAEPVGENSSGDRSFFETPKDEKRLDVPASIVFTGERRNNHYRVDVCQCPLELTANAVGILLQLVLAKDESQTGFVQLHALDVFRLRRILDEAVGPGTGKWLIATGGRQEYALNIPRDQLKDCVALTACFFELVDLKVVTCDQAKKLLALGRTAEIHAKSERNRAEIDMGTWII